MATGGSRQSGLSSNRARQSTTNLNKNIRHQREQSKQTLHIHIHNPIEHISNMEHIYIIGIISIMITLHLYKDYRDNKHNL